MKMIQPMHLRNPLQRGQSVVEYVIISIAVLAVLGVLRATAIQPGTDRVMANVGAQMADPVANADTILGAWE